MSNIILKPCPICKSNNIYSYEKEFNGQIGCVNYGYILGGFALENLIEKWNEKSENKKENDNMNNNDIEKLKVGMWIKTNTGLVAKAKYIDMRFPIASNIKFPIIYTDDNKTCWSCDDIKEYGWNLTIS